MNRILAVSIIVALIQVTQLDAITLNGLTFSLSSEKVQLLGLKLSPENRDGRIPIAISNAQYLLKFDGVVIYINEGNAAMFDPTDWNAKIRSLEQRKVENMCLDWIICETDKTTCGIHIYEPLDDSPYESMSVYFSITGKNAPAVAAAISEVVMSLEIRVGNETKYTYIQNHPIKDCIKELVEKLEKLKPSVPPMQKNGPTGQP